MRGLRRKREEKGLTQVQLAKKMEVTEQTIRNYERGETLHQKVIDKLSNILECTPGDLVNDPAEVEASGR